MPLGTPVSRGTTAAGATPRTTGSFTPSADEVLYAFVMAQVNTTPPGAISVSGGSLTWDTVFTDTHDPGTNPRWRFGLYRAVVGGSPSSMTVTASSSTAQNMGVSVVGVTGASDDITNFNYTTNANGDPAPVLPSPPAADSAVLAFFGTVGGTDPTTPSGFTQLNEFYTLSGPSRPMQASYDNTAPTQTTTWSTLASVSVGIAIEVKVAGSIGNTGTVARTLASLVSSDTTLLLITGTVNAVLGVGVAAGGNLPINGATDKTLAQVAATSIAGGLLINGSVGKTLAGLGLAVTTQFAFEGLLSETMADMSVASTATMQTFGTAGRTLANITPASTGVSTLTGAGANTLGGLSISSQGGNGLVGSAAKTLANVAGAGAGTSTLTGAAAKTLAVVVSAGSGMGGTATAVSATLASLTGVGTGVSTLGGSVGATLQGLSPDVDASNPVTGTAAGTLAALTVAAEMAPSTTMIATLDHMSGAASGSPMLVAALNAIAEGLGVTIAGGAEVVGAVGVTLDPVVASAMGPIPVMIDSGLKGQTFRQPRRAAVFTPTRKAG